MSFTLAMTISAAARVFVAVIVRSAPPDRVSPLPRRPRRTDAQLLRDFMRDYVRHQQEEIAHKAWFRAEVEQATCEADDSAAEWVPLSPFGAILGIR